MACARESPVPGYLMLTEHSALSWEEVADAAGMKLKEVECAVKIMEHPLQMIDFDSDIEAWFLPNWKERQFESDNVTKRTQEFRSREQVGNVP